MAGKCDRDRRSGNRVHGADPPVCSSNRAIVACAGPSTHRNRPGQPAMVGPGSLIILCVAMARCSRVARFVQLEPAWPMSAAVFEWHQGASHWRQRSYSTGRPKVLASRSLPSMRSVRAERTESGTEDWSRAYRTRPVVLASSHACPCLLNSA